MKRQTKAEIRAAQEEAQRHADHLRALAEKAQAELDRRKHQEA